VLARLGKVSDAAIARQAGCTRAEIARIRKRAGIAPFDALAKHMRRLGVQRDRDVAAAAGCSTSTVSRRRRALGIRRADRKRIEAQEFLRRYVAAADQLPSLED